MPNTSETLPLFTEETLQTLTLSLSVRLASISQLLEEERGLKEPKVALSSTQLPSLLTSDQVFLSGRTLREHSPQMLARIYLIGHLAGRSIPGVFPIGEVTKDSCKKTRNIYDYSRTILRGYKNSSSTGSFIKTKSNKIRYLTEIECERLQGFPDNWTQYGNYDGVIKPIAKTQRYKLIGNAVTVDIVELIAKRLKFIDNEKPTCNRIRRA